MKYLLVALLVFLMSMVIVQGCGGDQQDSVKQEAEPTVEKEIDVTSDMLTTTKDLTCGMNLNEHPIKDTTIYNGQLYGFCSEYCKKEFKKDPKAYLAKMQSGETKMHEHE